MSEKENIINQEEQQKPTTVCVSGSIVVISPNPVQMGVRTQ